MSLLKFKVVWNWMLSTESFSMWEMIDGIEMEFEDWSSLPFSDIDQSEDKVSYLLYTWKNDKNGREIYSKDVLQFSDKRERYRNPWLDKEEVLNDHEKYPFYTRVVTLPDAYERLLSSEIQQYREVVGNLNVKTTCNSN